MIKYLIANSYIYFYEGTWAWVHKNKVSDLSNKESIVISYTKTSTGINGYLFYSGKSNYIDDYLNLKRLSNKELVIAHDSKTVDSTGVYTLKGFKSFVKKQE